MEIKFSGVNKIFQPDIIALEDIYLQVEKGEFVYLVGETGSGKTTLLRCITREVVPTRGQISVGGNLLRKITGSTWPFSDEILELSSRAFFSFQILLHSRTWRLFSK